MNVRIILQRELDHVFELQKRGLSRSRHNDGAEVVEVNKLLKEQQGSFDGLNTDKAESFEEKEHNDRGKQSFRGGLSGGFNGNEFLLTAHLLWYGDIVGLCLLGTLINDASSLKVARCCLFVILCCLCFVFDRVKL